MGVSPIFWQGHWRQLLQWGLRTGGMTHLRICCLRVYRLVLPHQGFPLTWMGGDPFPRQVAHRLDAASPRVTHRR